MPGVLGTGVRTREDESVSDALAVVLRQAALTLVSYDQREPLSLGVGELLLLEALAQAVDRPIDEVVADAEARAGVDPGALDTFVLELRARCLLHPSVTRHPRHSAQHAEGLDEVAEEHPDDVQLVALTPLVFQLTDRGFELVDHDGRMLLRLDARRAGCAQRVPGGHAAQRGDRAASSRGPGPGRTRSRAVRGTGSASRRPRHPRPGRSARRRWPREPRIQGDVRVLPADVERR